MSPTRRVVAVAAYARGRVIGDHGRIPWHSAPDFAHFKRETLGHTLVMGRLTFDSIGRPLPGRRTIVVTRNPSWSADGVEVVHAVADGLALAESHDGDTVVAGGAQVYAQAMPHLTHQVLTEVGLDVAGDTHYPEFSLEEWREVRRDIRPDLDPPLDWVWWERR